MKIYFLSSTPCVLTINGVFYGKTDTFARCADIPLTDNAYAQFSPDGGTPLGFFITESLPFKPPRGCKVYRLKEGIGIYAVEFPPNDYAFRLIAQQRQENCLATVFTQGAPQLCIDSPQGLFNAYLPPSFAECTLKFYQNLLLLQSPTDVALYDYEGTPLLCERALAVTVEENSLVLTIPLPYGITARGVWQCFDGVCERREFTPSSPCFVENPADEGLAHEFFLRALYGGDFATLLHEDVRKDAEQIRAFLGEYIEVFLTDNPAVCGLLRKVKHNLYAADYYAVSIEKGKITDIQA